MSEFSYQSHNWLIHKLMWEELSNIAPQYAGHTLLDVGCGRGPYRNLFSAYSKAYFGLDNPNDHSGMSGANAYADAHFLPIASESVDTVLLSEVLEHLSLPLDALKETCRVLKPGGHLILTAPLFWHLHEKPRDYYRYTKYGLQFLLEQSGLKVVHVSELTGFIGTFTQLWCYFLWSGAGSFTVLRAGLYPVIWILQRLAYWANKLDRSRDFNCLTIMVGHKPAFTTQGS